MRGPPDVYGNSRARREQSELPEHRQSVHYPGRDARYSLVGLEGNAQTLAAQTAGTQGKGEETPRPDESSDRECGVGGLTAYRAADGKAEQAKYCLRPVFARRALKIPNSDGNGRLRDGSDD